MGCDIHGSIEVIPYPTVIKEWYGIIDLGTFLQRDYEMFSFLFGVREEPPYISMYKDRGLPEKLSEETTIEYDRWFDGGHSYSYILGSELMTIPKRKFKRTFNMAYDLTRILIKRFGIDNIRWIVWFDN